MKLFNQLLKLGEERPDLRDHLRPILDKLRKRSSLQVRQRDIEDAFWHYEDLIEGWGKEKHHRSEFVREDRRCMSLRDILYYDDGGWLTFPDDYFEGMSEQIIYEELEGFRGSDFADRAMKWREDKFPPIVLIVGPELSQVGDGRGRMTVAVADPDIDCLPAVVFKHKSLTGKQASSDIPSRLYHGTSLHRYEKMQEEGV